MFGWICKIQENPLLICFRCLVPQCFLSPSSLLPFPILFSCPFLPSLPSLPILLFLLPSPILIFLLLSTFSFLLSFLVSSSYLHYGYTDLLFSPPSPLLRGSLSVVTLLTWQLLQGRALPRVRVRSFWFLSPRLSRPTKWLLPLFVAQNRSQSQRISKGTRKSLDFFLGEVIPSLWEAPFLMWNIVATIFRIIVYQKGT